MSDTHPIAFQEKTTGEIRIAHYHPPETGLPAEWTDPFGVAVDAPATIADWKVVGA